MNMAILYQELIALVDIVIDLSLTYPLRRILNDNMVLLILVGDLVTHDDGRRGQVVEIDLVQKRARVKWSANRTWVSFTRLNRQATN